MTILTTSFKSGEHLDKACGIHLKITPSTKLSDLRDVVTKPLSNHAILEKDTLNNVVLRTLCPETMGWSWLEHCPSQVYSSNYITFY